MKQLELISKRAKPKFCNWLLLHPARCCGERAVVMIRGAAYCAEHQESAQKMFGQGKPIYA
jgi:hypothetical protein